MRVGITGTSLVYLAPASRRKGGSPRPNLGRLLLGKAMEPAVEQREPLIVASVEQSIDRALERSGF